jgi:hypothetical protein
VAAPPKLDGDDPLADASWQAAEVIGPLSSGGALESDDARTEARLLLSGATLYLGVRCFDKDPARITPAAEPDAIWSGDSVEFLFAAGTSKGFPLVHLTVGAAGRVTLAKHLVPVGVWG